MSTITTKQEAIEKLTGERSTEVAALSERVESAIRNYRGGSISVRPSDISEVNAVVAIKYRAAGWKVDFGDDQRDGAWMTLS